MTELYFVRHAESDRSIREETSRPLTPRGAKDANKLVQTFRDIDISVIYSSPYVRTIETVLPIANDKGIDLIERDDLRERTAATWFEDKSDFEAFTKMQWRDFDYSEDGGESLREVQNRNIREINLILSQGSGTRIIIATHGTALSAICNYYDPRIGHEYFWEILDKMPYVLRMDFDGGKYVGREEVRWSERPGQAG